ncbi:MAG: uracil-DNA glycosylase [Chloroflexota bacterium]|nr:uracil-DNA glycosylase [Chloroflexota bacterium]
MAELHKEIGRCQACDLARGRTLVVPGDGPEDAQIVFIGEAPGWNEDQQGRPFVGQAGQFLDQLLAQVNLPRGRTYITNVIKCRPPNNRDPLPSEMEMCRHWLDRQLETLKPKMIVTLGRYSMARYFPGETISKVHGTARSRDGIIYFAMYHPAAALHQQSLRHTIEEDMKKIPAILAQAQKVPEAEKKPQQLSFF